MLNEQRIIATMYIEEEYPYRQRIWKIVLFKPISIKLIVPNAFNMNPITKGRPNPNTYIMKNAYPKIS